MLASRRPAGKCIFCLFRSQSLQSRRNLSATARALKSAEDGSSTSFRFTGRRGPPGRDRRLPTFRLPLNDEEKASKLSSQRRKKPPPQFLDILKERVNAVRGDLSEAPIVEYIRKEGDSFNRVWKGFARQLLGRGLQDNQTQELKNILQKKSANALDDRLKYMFYDHITSARFTESDIRNQKALADLRYPTEWFPGTRTMHRTIHLHVGPTNSGKTYHALQRLEQAESGIYAGPLRLLAHEIYTRLNAKGKRCMLVTGEERRSPDESMITDMSSCTVEMMPLNKPVDVAVIDEIQMIGNAERGWAWTQAVLGVRAKEVHLCGEARTVPLIRELCASLGEKLEVHEYKRLSPLKVSETSLNGDLKKLRKGDCVVSFSVMGIHALRRSIERVTGRKVATVYGSLPPETRAQQARLFNDPNNDYDFLVASDAIGMGLNLSIKRVIFESASKFDGFQQKGLSIADVKQIGGRAGRYRTAEQATETNVADQSLAAVKGEDGIEPEVPVPARPQNLGLVTTLEKFDFTYVKRAMESEPEPIKTAGLFPPAAIVERFASYFPPGTPFSYILLRLHELSQMHSRFHLCQLRDHLWVADLIEPISGLTTNDRLVFCAAPASKSDSELYKFLVPALARCVEQQSGGSLVDIEEMPLEVLEEEVSPNREYLRALERLHKGVVLYLWLSYRFAGIFSTRPLANYVKSLVEDRIEQVLSSFSFVEAHRKKITAKRETSMIEALRKEIMREGKAEGDESSEAALEAQTSNIAGGDRFGGEDDLEFSEPLADEQLEQHDVDTEIAKDVVTDQTADAVEDKPSVSSFAEWRKSMLHLRDEDEASWERYDENRKASKPLEESGETADLDSGRLEAVRAPYDPNDPHGLYTGEGAIEDDLSEGDDIMPAAGPAESEMDADSGTVHEVDSDSPPLRTQAMPPTAAAAAAADLESRIAADRPETLTKQPAAGHVGQPFASEMPKHLHATEGNATEAERELSSRP